MTWNNVLWKQLSAIDNSRFLSSVYLKYVSPGSIDQRMVFLPVDVWMFKYLK